MWCPAAVCTFGPAVREEFELDLLVRPHPESSVDRAPEHRQAQASALAGDLGSAQAAGADLYAKAFDTVAAAEAQAVRPLT